MICKYVLQLTNARSDVPFKTFAFPREHELVWMRRSASGLFPSAANKQHSHFRLCECEASLIWIPCQTRYSSFIISQFVNRLHKDSNVDESLMWQLTCFWHVAAETKKSKNVKKSPQFTQNSRHTSCLSMCTLWHVEFLNEQECVHKRLSSPLHLGTLHDVFVQMISLARRQPNYLSSSVSSEPKRTSTLAHTHSCTHTTALSEWRSAIVSWKLLLCCSVLAALSSGWLIFRLGVELSLLSF